MRESMRYIREIRSARFLEQPGFRGLPGKGLSMPIDAWFHDKGFQFVREAFIPVVCTVLCGNRLDSVPAAYLAKLENIRLRLPMWRNAMLAMQQVRLGNQNIWQRVAQNLDVRFGQAVTDLQLEEGEIKVWTKANEHIFDRLIWTAGLPRLGKMLAAQRPQSGSRQHYDKVRHLKRAITTYRVEGLPRRIFWAFPDNILRQASGVPYGFISWEGSDIYSFYPWLNGDQNIDALDRATRETVASLGGKVIEQVLETFVMDYHPYFDSSMIEAGVFDDIEREQGRDGFYIAGETVSGITLPAVTEYANDLVTRYF
jgi:hypothetical protein